MQAPQATLEVAVIVARWLEKEAGVRPQVKWPNDVLIGGRKCCGILTELRADSARVDALIIGIGVNILPFPEETPLEIRALATSVADESSRDVSRAELAGTLADSLAGGYAEMVQRGGFDRRAWLNYSCTVGSRVRVHPPGGAAFDALAVDVSPTGVLLVDRGDGRREEVIAGDVIPRGES
jgi:BirA family biotin operon repressor/biotin-[acetyl-CoA-carboxylase] ligase